MLPLVLAMAVLSFIYAQQASNAKQGSVTVSRGDVYLQAPDGGVCYICSRNVVADMEVWLLMVAIRAH
jgi:hypothetical protein